MIAAWVLLAAWAAEGPGSLDRAALLRAEWSRDVATLLAGSYEAEDLRHLAVALGRTREPAVLDRLVLLAGLSDPEVREAAVAALGSVPSSAPALRALLRAEKDAEGRAALWRALGRQGDVADLPALISAVARPAPEGAGAAKALGRLARRGIDASHAADALVAAALAKDRERAELAAWALSRVRPTTLAAADREALLGVWRRSLREEVHAWLLPVLLDSTDDAGRRALAVEVMGSPWRAAKAALLAASSPVSWTSADLAAWAADEDPWVRQRLAEMTGQAAERSDPTAADRAALAAGDATARGRLLAAALDPASLPRFRTSAAASLLVDPLAGELTALRGGPDPAVRELVAEHLGSVSGGSGALVELLVAEADPAAQVAALDALALRLDAGEQLPPVGKDRLGVLARHGVFGVRQRAVALTRRLGLFLVTRPVDPGPTDLVRDLDVLGKLAVARVTTTEGELRIALEPDIAPLAVSAFTWLAERDRFDGLAFHRVVPGFVVQTGDPRGDGLGGPGWMIPDETSDLPFLAGSVGIARSGPDTGGSQWFVVTTDQPHLAGDYTRFGHLADGLEVARRLGPDDRVLDVVVERLP